MLVKQKTITAYKWIINYKTNLNFSFHQGTP